MGGNDEPGEVLVSFFYRFSSSSLHGHDDGIDALFKTDLTDCDDVIVCSGGQADLSPCHKMEYIVILFDFCWRWLCKLQSAATNDDTREVSLLHGFLSVDNLQRADSQRRASKFKSSSSSSSRHSSGAQQEAPSLRKPVVNHVFSRPTDTSSTSTTSNGTVKKKKQQSPKKSELSLDKLFARNEKMSSRVDADEAALLRGYGMKIDPANGNLISTKTSSKRRP